MTIKEIILHSYAFSIFCWAVLILMKNNIRAYRQRQRNKLWP